MAESIQGSTSTLGEITSKDILLQIIMKLGKLRYTEAKKALSSIKEKRASRIVKLLSADPDAPKSDEQDVIIPQGKTPDYYDATLRGTKLPTSGNFWLACAAHNLDVNAQDEISDAALIAENGSLRF